MEQQESLKIPDFVEGFLTTLEKRQRQLKRNFARKHRKVLKWAKQVGVNLNKVYVVNAKIATTVTLSASLFFSTALPITAMSVPEVSWIEEVLTEEQLQQIRGQLNEYLISSKKPNSNLVASLVAKITNMPVKAKLAGGQLRRVYGRIGAEQHLRRFPGDTISQHFQNDDEFSQFAKVGMAPSTGAWGYFAPTAGQLTDDLAQKEKYYLAIQTFLGQNWDRDWPRLKEWYEFRKMLVYNPENGKAVVAVVADAGPAVYTGKHFGGSPEVIAALGVKDGDNVVLLFVDDRQNQIELGPLKPPPGPFPAQPILQAKLGGEDEAS